MACTRLNPDTANGNGSINVAGLRNTSNYSWARYGKVVTVNVAVHLTDAMSAWSSKTLITGMPNAEKGASVLLPLDNNTTQAKLVATTGGEIQLASRGASLSNNAVLNGSITYICT